MDKVTLKNNKELKVLIGIVAFIFLAVIIVTSYTYAFFNYTKTGDINTVGTGNIEFSFTDGSSEITKGNVFPIDDADVDNTITKEFSITSHVTYSKGLRYNVYVVYGDNVSGKTRLRDDVVSFKFTPAANANGFTNQVNNCVNATSLTFTNGKALVASGVIKNTTASTTKNYTIQLWIDSSKISISSTTKRATLAEGNPSLADATSGNTTATRYMRNDSTESSTITLYPAIASQQGKIIYTTNEFSNSFYSYRILVEAYDEVGS